MGSPAGMDGRSRHVSPALTSESFFQGAKRDVLRFSSERASLCDLTKRFSKTAVMLVSRWGKVSCWGRGARRKGRYGCTAQKILYKALKMRTSH